MGKLVGLVIVMALVTSCSGGGMAVSTGVDRWQAYWPEIGIDRYQPVVYPAESDVLP